MRSCGHEPAFKWGGGGLGHGQLVDIATVDELRSRARQRIDFHVEGDGRTAAAEFDAVQGVVSSSADGSVVHLVVEGSVDAALKAAAQLTVLRVVTLDTDLEDIFLAYYRDDEP